MKKILLIVILSLIAPALQAQLATPNDNGITFGHVHLNVSDIEEHKRIADIQGQINFHGANREGLTELMETNEVR